MTNIVCFRQHESRLGNMQEIQTHRSISTCCDRIIVSLDSGINNQKQWVFMAKCLPFLSECARRCRNCKIVKSLIQGVQFIEYYNWICRHIFSDFCETDKLLSWRMNLLIWWVALKPVIVREVSCRISYCQSYVEIYLTGYIWNKIKDISILWYMCIIRIISSLSKYDCTEL